MNAEKHGIQEEIKKFRELVQFFRKYGDQYGMDWMLMAAQGYQETRLAQNAKSPVGAIGVMQVMPATGKELKVGDIRLAEPNINAGVKSIRFMVDHSRSKRIFARSFRSLNHLLPSPAHRTSRLIPSSPWTTLRTPGRSAMTGWSRTAAPASKVSHQSLSSIPVTPPRRRTSISSA